MLRSLAKSQGVWSAAVMRTGVRPAQGVSFLDAYCQQRRGLSSPATPTEDDMKADQEEHPDIILLDLNMPIMDGWGFLDGLKDAQIQSGFKVYVLTSSLDDRDRTRAQNYQMVEGYLTKPLNDMVIQGILQ